jgi:apolipoprotein N-acyltransferase
MRGRSFGSSFMSRAEASLATPSWWSGAAAVLSGALLSLAFPLPDQGWVAFIALVPLIAVAGRSTPRRAARIGYATGLAFFATLLYWLVGVMHRYGGLPVIAALGFLALLVAYLALFVAVFAGIIAALAARAGPAALLAAPVLWVGLEYARGHLLTGFPWGLVGYTQWRNTALLQIASIGGVHALSFLVLLANAAIAVLVDRRAAVPWRIVAAGGCLLVIVAHAAGAAMLPPATPAAAPGRLLEVAAIQANVAQDRKWERAEEDAIVTGLLALTEEAARDGARLVVWPESASPRTFRIPASRQAGGIVERTVEPRRDYADAVGALAREHGLTLVAGSVDYRWEGERLRAFNSAVVVQPDGAVGASYDKIRLVPFGEYVPLRRLLFFVDPMVQGAIADFAPGTRRAPLPTPAGPAATFICYEAIFPDLVRALAREAAFMVNITNDAWFGKSAAPRQHLAMAAFRAAENRRWLVRAANTGISALVDPWGRVRASAPLEVRAVLRGAVEPRADRSPFSRVGDVAGIACAILTAFVVAALRAAFLRPGS